MKKSLLLILISELLPAAFLFAQPGTLDIRFGGDGKVSTGFEDFNDQAGAMIVQPDGRIVLAGSSYKGLGVGYDFSMLRYNSDGTLDPGFGTGGKVLTDFIGDDEVATAIARQPDGKLVVAGYAYLSGSQNNFAVARYNSDGSLDNTFNSDGKFLVDFNLTSDFANAIAIQADGKIILAGTVDESSPIQYYIGLTRLNPDGSLDNTFGSGGKVTINPGNDITWVGALAIQPDGKIVVAGETGSSANPDCMVFRFNSDGAPDNSFGSAGMVTTDINACSNAGYALAIQADNKIVVVGLVYDAGFTSSDIAVVRYNDDGSLDNTFGSGGILIREIGSGFATASSVVLAPEGKIVIAGSTDSDEAVDSDFALFRLNSDGSPDNSFGNAGLVTTSIGPAIDRACAVALAPGGEIVIAGSTSNGTDYDFAAACYIAVEEVHTGVDDFGSLNNSLTLYPNPVIQEATLCYSLKQDEKLSICLTDLQGRILKTFVEQEMQEAGKHLLNISFPEKLPKGTYLLIISSPKESESIQLIK
jgi:uncharacterized delta-60 repeat protein